MNYNSMPEYDWFTRLLWEYFQAGFNGGKTYSDLRPDIMTRDEWINFMYSVRLSERIEQNKESQMAEDSSNNKATRVAKLAFRVNHGYIPSPIDLSDLTLAEMDELKRLTDLSELMPLAQVAAEQTPNLTPEVLARWVGQVAPLVEAEKVLKNWFHKVGGLDYSDPQTSIGYGVYVMDSRPGREGMPIKGQGTDGADYFNTFSQFLEFALDFAAEHIARNAVNDYLLSVEVTKPTNAEQ